MGGEVVRIQLFTDQAPGSRTANLWDGRSRPAGSIAMRAVSLPQGGRTNTPRALQRARDEFFSSGRGDRVGVDNVIVLVSDGYSTEGPVRGTCGRAGCGGRGGVGREGWGGKGGGGAGGEGVGWGEAGRGRWGWTGRGGWCEAEVSGQGRVDGVGRNQKRVGWGRVGGVR